ncbi:MAG: hypothetical protein ACRC76_00750 [Proteocatella sp.]
MSEKVHKRSDGNSDTDSHAPRYDISYKKTVIISTCGFYISEGNYDAYSKKDDSYFFTKQMAALYNKKSWNDKDRVLEMNYTDIDKKYQIILSKDGQQAVMENKYTVVGDFEIMMKWDEIFGTENLDNENNMQNLNEKAYKKSNMNFMIIFN